MRTSMAAPTGGPKGVECWPRDTVLWVSTCHVKYLRDVLCVHFMRRSHFCWMVSLPMFFHTCPRKGFYEARTRANATEQSVARGFSALIHTIYRLYWVFNCMIVCIYYLTFAVSFVLQITYKSRLFLFLFCLQLCKTTCCHGCGLQGEEQAAGSLLNLALIPYPSQLLTQTEYCFAVAALCARVLECPPCDSVSSFH